MEEEEVEFLVLAAAAARGGWVLFEEVAARVGGLLVDEEHEDEEEDDATLVDRVAFGLFCDDDGVDDDESDEALFLSSPPPLPDPPLSPRFNLFRNLRALLGGASEAVVGLAAAILLFNLAFLAKGESLEIASFRLRRPCGTRDFLLLIMPCLALMVPLIPPPPAVESSDFLRI